MEISLLEITIEELRARLHKEVQLYNYSISQHHKFKSVEKLYKISEATDKELKTIITQLEVLLNKELTSFKRHK